MLIGGSILLALQNGGFRQGREAESLGVAEGTEEESYQDGFAEGHELPGEIDIIVAIGFWLLAFGKTPHHGGTEKRSRYPRPSTQRRKRKQRIEGKKSNFNTEEPEKKNLRTQEEARQICAKKQRN